MSNKEYLKQLFSAIHDSLGVKQPLEHYLDQKVENEAQLKRVYHNGGIFVEPNDDFKIEETSYEIFVSVPENVLNESIYLIYKLGNIEIAREPYSPSELLSIFKHSNIDKIKVPDPNKTRRFLRIFQLIHSNISLGKKADINQLLHDLANGEWVEGIFYQENENSSEYIEIKNNGAKIRRLSAPSVYHLVYAIAGGGNIADEITDINQYIFHKVLDNVKSLANDFNKEFVMCLMALETGSIDYIELEERYQKL